MYKNGIHKRGTTCQNGESAGDIFDGNTPVADKAARTLEGTDATQDDTVNLKRRVGLISGTALIVGTMIGSGIFVSPKDVLERSGSWGLSLIIWAACGLVALGGALSYAELGTLCKRSGGEHTYFMEAFGSLHPFWSNLPSFLFTWLTVLLTKPSALAIIALSFSEYFVVWTTDGRLDCDTYKTLITKFVAVLVAMLITFINCFSVRLATSVQNVFTGAKLLAVLIIIVAGMYKLAEDCINDECLPHLPNGFEGSSTSFGSIATAFYSGLWAYDGWNNLNYVTEEIINPFVNLPRAIMIGIPLVTLSYVLVNLSYLTVMTPIELLASDAVAVTFGSQMLGAFKFLMPLGVVMSTFGAANGTCFVAGRICFVSSREGHMVDILSYINIKRFTPSPALIFNGTIAVLMIAIGDIGSGRQ